MGNEKSAQPISRKGQIYKNNYLYVADPCSDLNATEGFLSCTYQQENRVYLLSDPAKMGGWKECYIYIMAYILSIFILMAIYETELREHKK